MLRNHVWVLHTCVGCLCLCVTEFMSYTENMFRDADILELLEWI